MGRPPRPRFRVPRAIFLCLPIVFGWCGSLAAQPPEPGRNLAAPVTEILVEGNQTIPDYAILRKINSRIGQRVSSRQVLKDVQQLYETRWFFRVEPKYRTGPRGLILVFRVTERPVVRKIEYRGNRAVSDRYLGQLTGLRQGSPFSVDSNQLCAKRIERDYHERGFLDVKVTLAAGGKPTDREIIFDIKEGREHVVGSIKLVGAKITSAAYLKTKLRTKSMFFGLVGGKYDPDAMPDDIAALRDFYYKLGFFDVSIKKAVRTREGRRPFKAKSLLGRVMLHDITYNIVEGPRYVVRSITLKGNKVISTQKLSSEFKLRPKDFFDSKKMTRDVAEIRKRYQNQGRTFAKVGVKPKFDDKPGVVDLVYDVFEDQVRYIRDIKIQIKGDYPRTKEAVVLNWLKLQQGDRANMQQIKLSELRLRGRVFENTPGQAPKIKVVKVNDDWQGKPIPAPSLPVVRGQNGELRYRHPLTPAAQNFYRRRKQQPQRLYQPKPQRSPIDKNSSSSLEVQFLDSNNIPAPLIIRGQNPGRLGRPDNSLTPLYEPNPSGNPLADYPQQPGFVDLDITVNEAQTGRFMFGVAVNSDAGLVGQLSVEERNFDLFRWPRSFDEFINGTAFRGAGQTFRMEAMPGDQVSRYLVSWTDPFIFNTDYSLSVSGFYFQRFYPDWDEERGGGRVTVGRQFTPDFSMTMGVRLEHVVVSNPNGAPPPAILARSVGDSFLSTYTLTLTHDTRDSPSIAGGGHLWRVSYEQAFGEFAFPLFRAEAKHYFTAHSRPDGTGRHIISAGAEIGWANQNIPIFERFFAGGFQTFRGFAFRGVSPVAGGVRTGGEFQLLGSVEYLMPITANDAMGMVFFTDFGTVDNNVTLDRFRVTAGFGFRVTVPAMGQVPLAFDFAFPILTEPFDDERIFSFFIGFTR